MGGISALTGKFTYITKPKFFDGDDTKSFLRKLREENPKTKICLFWDNCSIHLRDDVLAEV